MVCDIPFQVRRFSKRINLSLPAECLKRHPGGMATQTFAGPQAVHDPCVHQHCPCSTLKQVNRHRSPHFERKTLLCLTAQQRTHPLLTSNEYRTTSSIRPPLTLVKLSYRRPKPRARCQWGNISWSPTHHPRPHLPSLQSNRRHRR